MAGNFLTSQVTSSFSRRILLHGVSNLDILYELTFRISHKHCNEVITHKNTDISNLVQNNLDT